MSILSSPGPLVTGRRMSAVWLALALASTAPAAAQYPGGAVVQRLPTADDPAEKLAAALRTLAVSPRDLGALIEAGRDALTLGDPNAAVGFFGRASEVAPRDGRVKAGLGAALVQLEKPRDALRYFQEASALGIPDADLAEDRGLAYDLVGDPARAQRDYQTVLAAHPDDEAVRRRLALSQGISGNRAAAIATLDPLIRKRDIAAWRAQTFVLAMTGDSKGANDITRVMLPQQQAMLQPFLERLATLSPADKARAVHFGEMPAAGRSYSGTQLASIGTPATYAPIPAAPRSRPVAPAVSTVSPVAPVISTPAPVAVAASTPAVASRPAAVAAARTPRPSGAPRYVSADGTPMQRIEHSPQDMFTLGLPRYEYVPMPKAASARPRPAPVSTQPTVAAATQSPNAPAIATSRGPIESSAAADSSIQAEAVAASAPPPTVAAAVSTVAPVVAATSPVIAMPLGASGSAGHFDLPHEIANRRPVSRSVQPSARVPVPAAIPAPSAPAPTASADAAAAVPATATSRRAPTASESAPVGRTSRPVHARETASIDPADSPPASTSASVRHGRVTAKPTTPTADADAETTPAAEDRRGERGRGRKVGGDSDAPTETHGRGKADGEPKTSDDSRKSVKGRSGSDRKKADTTTSEDDGASVKSDKGRKHGVGSDGDPPGKTDAAKGGKSKAKASTGKEPAAPKVYVQVAGGANKADLDKAWAGVKAKAPDLMKGRTPSTTPLRATNRLLVGPFKDDDEAQAFVNKMAGKGLSGFTVKSAKGQKVEKVDAGK